MRDSLDSTDSCPFCEVESRRTVIADEHAVAIFDGFPVSPGHALIFPRRHVADLFELSAIEVASLLRVLTASRRVVEDEYRPAGFNVGVNIGRHAGQTVEHAHLHLIPRYPGDVPDPTGGVRNVIPGKGRY